MSDMKNAFVTAVEYYLPPSVYSNDDIARDFPEWPADKIFGKVGIRERHIAGNDECASDLAVQAAEILFRKHPEIDRNSIDFLIFCSQSPDYFLPSSSCLIQDRLGLPVSCGAVDINLGCSGYVYALSLSASLVKSSVARNVLMLTGETYSKFLSSSDKSNRSLFGDAGSATLVSPEGKYRIGAFAFGTDGSKARSLIVQSGGSRHKEPYGDSAKDFLFMDGAEIFSFTLDRIPQLVQETLSRNDMQKKDIDLFVFHQANTYILECLRKKIGIEKEKFYVCLEQTGNTVSNSIPIALAEAFSSGLMTGNVLLAGFGVGLSWAGTVLS